jgi:hypothetical protein
VVRVRIRAPSLRGQRRMVVFSYGIYPLALLMKIGTSLFVSNVVSSGQQLGVALRLGYGSKGYKEKLQAPATGPGEAGHLPSQKFSSNRNVS